MRLKKAREVDIGKTDKRDMGIRETDREIKKTMKERQIKGT